MAGLFSDETELIIRVYDSVNSREDYILIQDIINVNRRLIFGAFLPPGSNPNIGIVKTPGPGHQIDLTKGYLLVNVFIKDGPYHSKITLTDSADSEAWRRIVSFFFRINSSRKKVEVEEEKNVIRVGEHRAFHPKIADFLRKMENSNAAVFIFPGNDIDKMLNDVYLSKRSKPQGEE